MLGRSRSAQHNGRLVDALGTAAGRSLLPLHVGVTLFVISVVGGIAVALAVDTSVPFGAVDLALFALWSLVLYGPVFGLSLLALPLADAGLSTAVALEITGGIDLTPSARRVSGQLLVFGALTAIIALMLAGLSFVNIIPACVSGETGKCFAASASTMADLGAGLAALFAWVPAAHVRVILRGI